MSALWDYLNQQHGLTLVESEINDILELARQEIELPDEEEIVDLAHDYINAHGCYGNLYDAYKEGFLQSMTKVRNPYPKTIKHDKGDGEGVHFDIPLHCFNCIHVVYLTSEVAKCEVTKKEHKWEYTCNKHRLRD